MTETTATAPNRYEDILYEENNHVATITINRPGALNATRPQTFVEMVDAVEHASRNRAIGVLVIRGAGDKAFSSGGDVQRLKGEPTPGYVEADPRSVHLAIRHCGKPVIAVIKGYAIGLGNHLAYFCDLTIAAENAIFGQVGPRIGSPAEGWIVSYSARVLGSKKARELWMLCRRYNAQQALEMGLVNVVVPLDQLDAEVDKWCEEILALSPTCLRIVKESFESDIDYLRDPSRDHFRRMLAPDFLDTEESQEGKQAFREKRKPNYNKYRE
ncbi:MAG: enoyl-CoA hydratase-related protein [Pseudomonadota bacterium]